MREKLSENERFKLSCCFNFNHDMPFTKELKGHSRVRIVIGHGNRPGDDVHYKIIDEGIKAHISRHEVASQEKRYRVIDCTRVPRRRLQEPPRTRPLALSTINATTGIIWP